MSEIKVSQRAREAAAQTAEECGKHSVAKCILAGTADQNWRVQAFARFEQAIRADERERAATYIETHSYTVSNVSGPHMSASKLAKDDAHHATIAAAIRAQGDEA